MRVTTFFWYLINGSKEIKDMGDEIIFVYILRNKRPHTTRNCIIELVMYKNYVSIQKVKSFLIHLDDFMKNHNIMVYYQVCYLI